MFCRYSLSIDDDTLSGSEQFDMLSDLKGRPVAHRKANPTDDDLDTFLMLVKKKVYHQEKIITWHVAHRPGHREVSKYNGDRDELYLEAELTDEIKHTKFVALPRLGVLAIDDRLTGNTLGGKAAASRFKSIVAQVRGGAARIEFSGSNADVQRALDNWSLRTFSFDVRPFNPTLRKPGDQLHELMKEDNIGHIRGIATPAKDQEMRNSHQGLIAEATGLAEHGYGQVAVAGTTPEGFTATIGKPKFESDKTKNLKRQSEPRTMKVYIEEQTTVEGEEAEAVRALLEFYG